jgi:hypothetical protein
MPARHDRATENTHKGDFTLERKIIPLNRPIIRRTISLFVGRSCLERQILPQFTGRIPQAVAKWAQPLANVPWLTGLANARMIDFEQNMFK